MQRFSKNIFIIIFLAGLAFGQVVKAQSDSERLASADSLFEKRKYTEALNIYEQLLEKQGVFSPQMLAKIAYVKDGMGDYTSALYYLHLLYANNPNPEILAKIAELAEKYKLQGYQFNDLDYVLYNLRHYLPYLTVALLLGMVAGLAYLFWLKKRGREVLYGCMALSVVVGLFMYIYNYQLERKRGIVRAEKVFLMSSPSAAGELIATVSKGNCLPVVAKNDIWYEVRWNTESGVVSGYVRRSALWLLQ